MFNFSFAVLFLKTVIGIFLKGIWRLIMYHLCWTLPTSQVLSFDSLHFSFFVSNFFSLLIIFLLYRCTPTYRSYFLFYPILWTNGLIRLYSFFFSSADFLQPWFLRVSRRRWYFLQKKWKVNRWQNFTTSYLICIHAQLWSDIMLRESRERSTWYYSHSQLLVIQLQIETPVWFRPSFIFGVPSSWLNKLYQHRTVPELLSSHLSDYNIQIWLQVQQLSPKLSRP